MTAGSGADVVVRLAGIEAGTAAGQAVEGRADIMEMTQATHAAALTPTDPGGVSHAERAALAVRVARLNRDDALASHYEMLLDAAKGDDAVRLMADPAEREMGGARRNAIIAFTDLVTARPRKAQAEDIDALKAAGIGDADIVRLAELNAFLAYQVRLIAGLKLMRGAA
jgi:uncharacterized protein YciW